MLEITTLKNEVDEELDDFPIVLDSEKGKDKDQETISGGDINNLRFNQGPVI